MKKILLFIALSLVLASCGPKAEYPQVYAHRGCWLGALVPENSLWGVEIAARFGYPAIEIDVKYTLDSVMVIMHDGTVNRTMRNASDFSPIEEKVWVRDTPFDSLRTRFVLASDDPDHREPIPTLEEILAQCIKYGIHPVLHSHLNESYVVAQAMCGDDWTCFTSDFSNVEFVRTISNCPVLYDPDRRSAEECSAMLAALGGKMGMSTMKYDMLRSDYMAGMHEAGMVCQSSIFPSPREADAIAEGADIILSDFCWLQGASFKPVKTVKAGKVTLSAGQTYEFVHPAPVAFGAVTVEMEVCGKGVLEVNGKYSYDIPREGGDGRVVVGFRFMDETPTVRISCAEGEECSLGKLRINVYEL